MPLYEDLEAYRIDWHARGQSSRQWGRRSVYVNCCLPDQCSRTAAIDSCQLTVLISIAFCSASEAINDTPVSLQVSMTHRMTHHHSTHRRRS